MVCLGHEPGAAGWKVQINQLSYGGTPSMHLGHGGLIDQSKELGGLPFRYPEAFVKLRDQKIR